MPRCSPTSDRPTRNVRVAPFHSPVTVHHRSHSSHASHAHAHFTPTHAATYVTHPWRVKDERTNKVLVEFCGESAVISINHDGIATVQSLSSYDSTATNPLLAHFLLPPQGIPHPEYGTFRQRGAARGIPIAAFDCVSQQALALASECLAHLLADVDEGIVQQLCKLGACLGIIGIHQNTTDIPAHSHLKGVCGSDGRDYDKDIRGLGGSIANPMTTLGEENITMVADRRHPTESILVHEFAHTVMRIGLHGRPELRQIKRAYELAIKEGIYDEKYAKSYILSNVDEYWAEASQAWFHATVRTDVTAGMTTREDVKSRDPRLAAVLGRVWGDGAWRYPTTAPKEFLRKTSVAVYGWEKEVKRNEKKRKRLMRVFCCGAPLDEESGDGARP